MRFKQRYILFEIRPTPSRLGPLSLAMKDVYKAIIRKVEGEYGTFGFSVIISSFRVIYYNKNTKIAIAKCRRGPHRIMASVLPLISCVLKFNVQLHTLYTGATISQCCKFLKKYQQEYLRRLYKALPEHRIKQYASYESNVVMDEDLEILMGLRCKSTENTCEEENTNKECTTENENTFKEESNNLEENTNEESIIVEENSDEEDEYNMIIED